MKNVLAFVLLTFGLCTGCAKTVTAPVPGSNSTPDATAFRILADAQAALHSIKTWEQCSQANFPGVVIIDGTSEVCDATAGVFPPQFIPVLNDALTAYNALEVAGQAFHAGTSTDAAGLQTLEITLQDDVTALVTKTGGQ